MILAILAWGFLGVVNAIAFHILNVFILYIIFKLTGIVF